MTKHVTPRTGTIAAGCAAALMSLTTVAGCSDDGGGAGAPQTPTRAGDNLPPGADYWAGKADLSVFLCHAGDPRTGGCATGPVTTAQRADISTTLEAMPQVRQVYYEDHQEAWERLRLQGTSTAPAIGPEQLPDSFRVKLRDPGTAPTVISAITPHPGVASTTRYSPTAPAGEPGYRSSTARNA
ncbi:permease-like cell division protein FtsX [Embleya sp. MST-111070]|uniref:permease-like cell division protein FtsX n=1 Tax=Embleya sp. MST-111070 TaxID=3398231 RepID=UPI003F73F165